MDRPLKVPVERKSNQAKSRVVLLVASFAVVYCIIGGRLAQFAMTPPDTTSSILPPDRPMASRPDIVDRNGALLATDIRTVSLFAELNKIIDPDEAVEELRTVLLRPRHQGHLEETCRQDLAFCPGFAGS